jgi:hypothetical protein
MTDDEIKRALNDLEGQNDPTLKNLSLASLTSQIFREAGIDLVVVGGSAIELYTDGAYTSGDVDLCVLAAVQPLTVRRRQELMGKLGGRGGPRNWQVAGGFVDVLGQFENLAKTPIRKIAAPYGEVAIAPAEELLVERVLVSVYPYSYPPARDCALKLIGASLKGEVDIDWKEVQRLAERPEYGNFEEVRKLVDESAETLKDRSPYHSNE